MYFEWRLINSHRLIVVPKPHLVVTVIYLTRNSYTVSRSSDQWENRLGLADCHTVHVTRPRPYRVTDPRIFVISYHPRRCVWFTIRIICKLVHRRRCPKKRVREQMTNCPVGHPIDGLTAAIGSNGFGSNPEDFLVLVILYFLQTYIIYTYIHPYINTYIHYIQQIYILLLLLSLLLLLLSIHFFRFM